MLLNQPPPLVDELLNNNEPDAFAWPIPDEELGVILNEHIISHINNVREPPPNIGVVPAQ